MEDLVDQMLAAMDQNLSAYYDTMEAKNIDVWGIDAGFFDWKEGHLPIKDLRILQASL